MCATYKTLYYSDPENPQSEPVEDHNWPLRRTFDL